MADKKEKCVHNIHDYLLWRGDLKLSQVEFNEVDNLILCKLAMLDLDDIDIPDEGICLSELKDLYIEKHGDSEKLGLILSLGVVKLFKEAAGSGRFSEFKVVNYVNKIDKAEEIQFSATEFELTDGTHFVAFKGTDDTIIGFKEDFNMGARESVPAQEDARRFIESVCRRFDGKIRIGGHSKGGNLSVYAAKSVSPGIQDRIIKVYNNDGPGFRCPINDEDGYKRIKDKIINIVPEYSIVGVLLNQAEDLNVVKCGARGLAAHNGFTWEVMGAGFVKAEGLAIRSQIFDKAFAGLEENLSFREREEFTNALFDSVFSTGADTLTELGEKGIWENLKSLENFFDDSEKKRRVLEPMMLLLKEYFKTAGGMLPEKVIDKIPSSAVNAVKHPIKTIGKAIRFGETGDEKEDKTET